MNHKISTMVIIFLIFIFLILIIDAELISKDGWTFEQRGRNKVLINPLFFDRENESVNLTSSNSNLFYAGKEVCTAGSDCSLKGINESDIFLNNLWVGNSAEEIINALFVEGKNTIYTNGSVGIKGDLFVDGDEYILGTTFYNNLNFTMMNGTEITVCDKFGNCVNISRGDVNATNFYGSGFFADGEPVCTASNALCNQTADTGTVFLRNGTDASLKKLNLTELNATGDVWITDSGGESHLINRELSLRDEMYRNTTLTKINGTFIDGVLNIQSTSGEDIITNINANESSIGGDTDSIKLIPGTNESPILNQICYENIDSPDLAIRTTFSEECPVVATYLMGQSNYTYSSNIDAYTAIDFIRGVYNRFFDDGAIYKSGFNFSVSDIEVNITTPGTLKFLLRNFNMITNHSTSDFYIHLHDDGSFHQHSDLDDCADYNNGVPVGNNKYFNMVYGIGITEDGEGRMYVLTQNEPSNEYIRAIDAENDIENTLVFFPSQERIKKTFIPIVRVVVKRSGGVNIIQTLSSGQNFFDIRGTVVATASSPPTSGISSHPDLTNLDFASSGHTGFTSSTESSTHLTNGTDASFSGLNSTNGLEVTGTAYIGGNVGIGTSTPNEKLEVSGAGILLNGTTPKLTITSDATAGDFLYFEAASVANQHDICTGTSDFINFGHAVDSGTACSIGMRFDQNNRLIVANDIFLVDAPIDTGDDLIRLYDSGDDGVIDIYQNDGVVIRFTGTNGADNYINNGGKVGIGTATPGVGLDLGTNVDFLIGDGLGTVADGGSHVCIFATGDGDWCVENTLETSGALLATAASTFLGNLAVGGVLGLDGSSDNTLSSTSNTACTTQCGGTSCRSAFIVVAPAQVLPTTCADGAADYCFCSN